MFGDFVYHDEASTNPLHFQLNLGTIAAALLHPFATLSLTLPCTLVSLYAFWTSHWSLNVWFVGAAISGAFTATCLFILFAGVMQLAAYFQLGHQPSRRWKPLSSEVAIITGGASGIGFECAKRFAALGIKVAIWDIQQPIADYDKDKFKFYLCDITNMDKVVETVNQVEKDLGDVSILVNNAGVVSAKPILELDPDSIKRTFNVNIVSHFWTVKAVLPRFKDRKYGHIITVASTMGLVSVADMTDYCASKYAAVGFADALRQEIQKFDFKHLIHTTCVCPGLILTGMFRGIRIRSPFLNPPLKPSQVADVVVDSVVNMVGIPADLKEDASIDYALKQKQISYWDRFNQHKVVWTPLTYYILPLLNICLPAWMFDAVKSVMGGNHAITPHFVGRKKE